MLNNKRATAFITLIVSLSLAGCGGLAERLSGPGELAAESALTLEASLEPGEGIGGGALEPADIGTAIQLTLDAASTPTPSDPEPSNTPPQPSNTPVPPSATVIVQTSTPAATATVPGAQLTSLAHTLTAIVVSATPSPTKEDSTAAVGATATATETQGANDTTLAADGTASPTPSLTQTALAGRPCLALRFVADVTISDGTPVQPGSTFFKSWYVQNIGGCRWEPNFNLVYVSGVAIGANDQYALGTFVNPDQFVTLTAQMTAPTVPGYHTSYWGLEDGTGQFFGMLSGDEEYDQPFYVQIFVLGASQGGSGGSGDFPSVVVTSPPFTPGP